MTILYYVCVVFMGALMSSLGVTASNWKLWAALALMITVREISRSQFNGPAEGSK